MKTYPVIDLDAEYMTLQKQIEILQIKSRIRELQVSLDILQTPTDGAAIPIPQELADDEDALAKKRIYPDLRRAESRYFAVLLRNTLESSAQWGAVRVAPETVEFIDLRVNGRIVESDGKRLQLEITAQDAAGRVWLDRKRFATIAAVSIRRHHRRLEPIPVVIAIDVTDLLIVTALVDAVGHHFGSSRENGDAAIVTI
jgi:hypothetical protein